MARAGTTAAYSTGGTLFRGDANYNANVGVGAGFDVAGPQEVGTYRPNAFGLHEVHGNDGAPTDGTAWTAGGDCGWRVLRGGSWVTGMEDARSTNRYSAPPDNRNQFQWISRRAGAQSARMRRHFNDFA